MFGAVELLAVVWDGRLDPCLPVALADAAGFFGRSLTTGYIEEIGMVAPPAKNSKNHKNDP